MNGYELVALCVIVWAVVDIVKSIMKNRRPKVVNPTPVTPPEKFPDQPLDK